MPSPRKLPRLGQAPRRGEVWCVRLDPTLGAEIKKTRPCLVLTTNVVNQFRRTIVVGPLSRSPQASPAVLVPVICAGRWAMAVVDQVRAVAKERLHRRLGSVSAEHLRAIEDALREILEL